MDASIARETLLLQIGTELGRVRFAIETEMAGVGATGYANAMIDLGFIAMTAFATPGAAPTDLVAKALIRDAMRQKFFSWALRAAGEEILKDVVKYQVGQDIKASDVAQNTVLDVTEDYLVDKIKTEILQRRMFQLQRNRLPLHRYTEMRKTIEEHLAGPIGDLIGQSMNFYNMGMDAAIAHQQWEFLRLKRINIMQHASEVEREWQQAHDESGIAKADYENCMRIKRAREQHQL